MKVNMEPVLTKEQIGDAFDLLPVTEEGIRKIALVLTIKEMTVDGPTMTISAEAIPWLLRDIADKMARQEVGNSARERYEVSWIGPVERGEIVRLFMEGGSMEEFDPPKVVEYQRSAHCVVDSVVLELHEQCGDDPG